jgi:hypothetical protein
MQTRREGTYQIDLCIYKAQSAAEMVAAQHNQYSLHNVRSTTEMPQTLSKCILFTLLRLHKADFDCYYENSILLLLVVLL